MSVYFSSGAFQGNLGSILDACEAEALPGLEFTSNFPFAVGISEQVRAARTRHIPLLVHNYFPPPPEPFVLNLASANTAVLEASLALCRNAIELSRDIGAPFYSVHSGFAMELSWDQLGDPAEQAALAPEKLFERSEAEGIFRESIQALSAHARTCGIGLLIENNVLTQRQVAAGRAATLLMTSPREIGDFFESLGDDNAGFLLDVAHAKVAAGALGIEPADYFKALAGHIRALHLSDNDGISDSNQPIRKGAWFAQFLPEYAHLPMIIEVYRLDASGRKQQVEIVESFVS